MSIGIPANFYAAILYFLIPLALTIVVETLVGVCFGMSKEGQRALLLINAVTNPTLCLLLYFYRLLLPWGDAYALALLEAAVVIGEWQLLKALCGAKRRYFPISLACNAASFGAGLLISLILF